MAASTNIEVMALGNHLSEIDDLLTRLKDLPGDIAEFGVYAGATTRELAKYGRTVWAFDTFSGLPGQDWDESIDTVDLPGKFAVPGSVLEELGAISNVRPVVGRFNDTLPALKASIALAYVDCDFYQSTKQALKWLAENMVDGGVVFFDDYATHVAVRKAIKEELDRGVFAEWLTPWIIRKGQVE